MSHLAEFTIPPESFPFGETLLEMPDIETEVDQIIPAGEAALPFFWVRGSEPEEFMTAAEQEPDVIQTYKLESVGQTALYRAEWQPGTEVTDGLTQLNITIVEAVGTADSWRFEIRVESRSELRLFQDIFQIEDGEIELVRMHDLQTTIERTEESITKKQREALQTAFENGYFEFPRRTTLTEISADFDISARALSERIRRGTKNLVESELVDGDDG